jgi:hypothetical protein
MLLDCNFVNFEFWIINFEWFGGKSQSEDLRDLRATLVV